MAPPNNTSGMEFEVFLSFRGPDTRDNFTSCLYHNMVEKGIRVFKDDEELRVGQQIGGNLLRALDDTQIYIPIFSKGFASSVWCLREVAHMVDCTSKSNGKKEILPLFFDVKPDDVKLRTELYSNAMSEHEKKYGPDEVKRWKAALREVATRLGWMREGKEYGELIKLIVREVLLKLKVMNRSRIDNLVEMDDVEEISRIDNLVEMDDVEEIEELLKVEYADHIYFVIIHGTGGIGKTTLASIIFNRFQSEFNCSSFLEDVQDLSQRYGLLHVQKKLLSDTLGSALVDGIHDTDDGIDHIRRGLSNKKVLVVVDNVNDKKQLENLAGSYTWFGSGSRIIVTGRDIKTILDRTTLDKDKQMQPSYYIDYPVKEMRLDRAIQLFSKHAFRSNTPPKGLYNFSEKVVSSIGRLPLILEVVGSLFANTDRPKWEETLKDFKQVLCKGVRETLMISFNKLDLLEKELFLDIACFCFGEDKMNAYYMWDDCRYSPHSAIDKLLRMSLIRINEDNTFWMHKEVRDLGRYIIEGRNIEDAGKCRWVEIGENSLNILRSNEEKGAVQALSLSISHDLTPEELAHLPMLRFLGGERLNFVGDFKNLLLNLRWLAWHHCPLDFSATNFHLVNLVVLNLSESKITDDWGGWRQIEMAKKLKTLNLTRCCELTKTPNFSEFGKLEKLILESCWKLSTLNSSIGKLKLLTTLNIKGCRSLKELPEEIGSLECLSEIIMPNEDKLFKLPETLGNLKSFTKFENPYHCHIIQLPRSIVRLNLTHLVLSSWNCLPVFSDNIGELKSLIHLNLRSLEAYALPNCIGRLKNLKHLLLSECKNLRQLPYSIVDLHSLVELDIKLSGIAILPNSIGRLKNLKHLRLSKCENLHVLPDSIGGLSSLVELDLKVLKVFILPISIGMLTNLKYLLLSKCKNLHELPDSIGELEALVVLDLELSGVYILPNSIGRLKNLKRLLLSECKNLVELPNSIGELEALVKFDLKLSRVAVLPNSIGKLKNLKHLLLYGCKNLYELPDSIGKLDSLVELDLKVSGISILPNSIGRLKNLKYLLLSECKNLHELPDSIGELEALVVLDLELSGVYILPNSIGRLKNLKRLLLSECENLVELPDSIGELEALVKLDLKLSGVAVLPNSIGKLKNLKHLLLYGCKNEFDVKPSEISYLPDSIGRLNNFKSLCLSECKNPDELLNSIREIESLVQMKDGAKEAMVLIGDSCRKSPHVSIECLLGIDKQVEDMMDLLDLEVNDVRIVGIWGMGGVGKTTLAKIIYEQISSQFDYCSFLPNIAETTKQLGGVRFLQRKLMFDILKQEYEVDHLAKGINFFKEILQNMKVLIVLDDVEVRLHLHKILGEKLDGFGYGSRIIVTTSILSILPKFISRGTAHFYEIKMMNNDQALELFRNHALRRNLSIPGFDEAAKGIVNFVNGIPLLIEVIGSLLGRKLGEKLIARVEPSLQFGVPIQEILMVSYEELSEVQREIILDIACLPADVDCRIASFMWHNLYFSSSHGIDALDFMSLVKIGQNNELGMHRLLREFGQQIIQKEDDLDPGRHGRLCNMELTWNSEKMEGTDQLNFVAEDFKSMPNIKFLILDCANIVGDFANVFTNLKWLQWQGCARIFEATNFHVEKLVILDLSWSKVTEDWGGWREIKMPQLKVLNLTGCADLLISPDFSSFPDLEILILERCSQLLKLDPSIRHLKCLTSLNLRFCNELNMLPVELGHLEALKELHIDGTSIQEIPESIGCMERLEIFSASNCLQLSHLPDSLCSLTGLSVLLLENAKITGIPDSVRKLVKLRHLSLKDCRWIGRLPDLIRNLERLELLDITGTGISKLPNSITCLRHLKVLKMDSCFIRELPREIGNLANLEELHASHCRSLKGAIPTAIKSLDHLRVLRLGHSSISGLPSEITNLSCLQTLDLLWCNRIQALPELPSSLTCLRVSSERMKALPDLKGLVKLEEIYLGDTDPKELICASTWKKPRSSLRNPLIVPIGLPKLKILELSHSKIIKLPFRQGSLSCKRLKKLVLSGVNLQEVSELPSSLSVLSIQCCLSLKGLPAIGHLRTLSELNLIQSSVEEIKGLEGLIALEVLNISYCEIRNLNGLGQLRALRSLILSDCDALDKLPDISNLKTLNVLEVQRCRKIHDIEGIMKLTSLEVLRVSECKAENAQQVQDANAQQVQDALKLTMA